MNNEDSARAPVATSATIRTAIASRGLIAGLAFAAVMSMASAAEAGDWSSSDKWGTVQANGFTIRNNVWGQGWVGPQSIWASWGSGWTYWGVWADHPNTGGIKSYPHIAKWVGRNTNNIPWIGSWFQATRPSAGAYNTAYDVWFNNHSLELMIWMNKQGDVGPIGSYQANVTIGDHNFNIYRGWNGYNDVVSYVRTSNVNTGNVDIKWIVNDMQSRGYTYNPYMEDIQCGFEITSSSGGMVFELNGFATWMG